MITILVQVYRNEKYSYFVIMGANNVLMKQNNVKQL